MKRVLLLIKGLGRGGAEEILAATVRHLDRSRFTCEVAYLLPWKDALVQGLEGSDVTVTCLHGERGPAWMWRLRRLVEEHRIDLVHSHSPVAAVGARVALGHRAGRVYTEHNVWGRYHRVTYWANLLTFPYNDHVFAVSEHVRESVRYPSGLRWRRVPPTETLYHGIDPTAVAEWGHRDGVREELGIPEDAPVVGTVANLKAHKRIDQLLRAVYRVRAEVPGVRFVLVGDGPLKQEIRRMARDLALEGTVVFTGFRDDATRLASCFDVFALSSEHEGLSIALIEALALGKPAVVTRVGGLSEVVQDGRSGFLVRVDDPTALADRILQLLRDPDLRSRMGEEGRSRAASFDIRRSVRRMEDVYEELLS